ncbi:NADPH-dependent FMN reductase [Streptomyces sp. SID8382]|uniref:NADPH-dependent FMN reductase n=1 Tax=Streptomyces malaysiensis TaxID=92644 RepID=UPI000CA3E0CD|nr:MULTISPECIES: NAD(P)H-dependent oxidoreductase [unclassified Streptomyces]AUA14119.1 NADPH azoreductase [Streptomyces sp. M56]MYX57027.1 NADPH-dependent FMN reductase [Streptomyces sp. SID8382]
MTRIVLISGSLRHDSLNTMAIATIERMLTGRPEPAAAVRLAIEELPYYHQSDDESGKRHEAVHAARHLVTASDAVLISTPSYNGLVSGVLKNALDWLSRPWGDSALTDKPVAMLSASTSARGAMEAQSGLRTVLERSGAVLIAAPQVALARADAIPAEDGRFTEPATVAALEALVEALLAHLSPEPAAVHGISSL